MDIKLTIFVNSIQNFNSSIQNLAVNNRPHPSLTPAGLPGPRHARPSLPLPSTPSLSSCLQCFQRGRHERTDVRRENLNLPADQPSSKPGPPVRKFDGGGRGFLGDFSSGHDPSYLQGHNPTYPHYRFLLRFRPLYFAKSPAYMSPQKSKPCLFLKKSLVMTFQKIVKMINRPKPKGYPLRFFFRVGALVSSSMMFWVLGYPQSSNGLPQSFSGHQQRLARHPQQCRLLEHPK